MMQRRTFIEIAGAGAVSVGLARFTIPASGGAPFRAWAWVHGSNDEAIDWRARFGRLRASGISGVLVGGGATARIAAAAHAEGMAFHAWTWILNRAGDTWAKTNHPEWFDVSRKGESSLTTPPYVGYYQWLCPTRPAVRDYLAAKVREVADIPGVDAVHLDYIRHPDVILPVGLWEKYKLVQDHEMAEYDFCYCEVCRTTFKAAAGYDPLSLSDPSADVAWREFRWQSVTDLVKVLATAVHERGREISAAVFPTPALARMQVRQAWDQWPLDSVFPMTYHGFHNEDIAWIGAAVKEGMAAIPASRPLYAGLYLPDLDPASSAHAVEVVRESGGAGVAFFEAGGLTDAHLVALRRVLAA